MANSEESQSIHTVEVKDLVNWKVLTQNGNEFLATNAFVLLTSDFFEYSSIQCARFKGIDRTVFIDKKEYSGPLYEQIENAYNFILNHINLAVGIDGLQRSERYELPTRSIREMIVNAITHRNYMIDSRIQVAVYDDRIEVTSLGMLFGSLDIAAIKSGRSETRNRTIARVFDKMHLIESWGTGIRRIIEDCAQLNLPEPVFSEIGDAFRVEVYRKQAIQPATGQASTEQVPSKYRASTEQVPSKHRASTEQVTEERIKELIEYCSTPRKRSEMQAFLGLTHREHFREPSCNHCLIKA
jgi:predicted HTH transcriptional regulator